MCHWRNGEGIGHVWAIERLRREGDVAHSVRKGHRVGMGVFESVARECAVHLPAGELVEGGHLVLEAETELITLEELCILMLELFPHVESEFGLDIILLS